MHNFSTNQRRGLREVVQTPCMRSQPRRELGVQSCVLGVLVLYEVLRELYEVLREFRLPGVRALRVDCVDIRSFSSKEDLPLAEHMLCVVMRSRYRGDSVESTSMVMPGALREAE